MEQGNRHRESKFIEELCSRKNKIDKIYSKVNTGELILSSATENSVSE